jgi:uncharacterized iron-regulated protein
MNRPSLSAGPSRRHLLAAAAAPLLGSGCASWSDPPDRIVEVTSGRELTRAELLAALRRADHILLGEQHDNPHHHQRRGALIVELGAGTVVVAEQMPRGARVAAGADLRTRLEAAGFDAKAWGWPLYQPLFGPLLAAGLPLLGGNAPVTLARQIAREGPSAWPAELRERLDAVPLTATAQAALDRDLLDGHCGHLSAARLPAMRAAQRARDASMALAMQACGGRPAVLVAGNGHVRTDQGVASLLRALPGRPQVLCVGFGETGWSAAGVPYTHLWITPAVQRADPCAGFRMPAPRPA